MINSKLLIVIPFLLPWDWSADYQKQTCLTLAEMHHYHVYAYMQKDAIFWFKKILQQKKIYPQKRNITYYQPLYFFPFRRFHSIERVNYIVSFYFFELFILKRNKYILWIFDPFFYFIANPTQQRRSLYDCVDYNRGIPDRHMSKKIGDMEDKLISRVTYFFVNSHILSYLHSNIRTPEEIVSQGFDINAFQNHISPFVKFPTNKPIIGYVGALNYRLDFTLLKKLVFKHPEWNFVLWGDIQNHNWDYLFAAQENIQSLLNLPNVINGKSINKKEIPGIIEQFDICMIPYNTSLLFNKYCYPMKLFEYFYMGKPVISTSIKELEFFSKYVRTDNSATMWEKQISQLLTKKRKKSQGSTRNLALENTWREKINKMLLYINN